MNEFMRQLLFLPEQASTVARQIDALHYVVITTTMLGALLVSVLVGIFLIRYRSSTLRADVEPDPRPEYTSGGLHLNTELLLFGLLLGLFLLFWIVGFRQFVILRSAPLNALDVYVTGKQWMWSFAYPNGAGSNGVLYVPEGRPIRLLLTSRDVIHSFFVPQFRIKQDAVPGQITSTWFEATQAGTYDIYCTEYCGTEHSRMRARVQVLTPEDYSRLLETLPAELQGTPNLATVADAAMPGRTSLQAMGERLAAEHGCLRCHTVDGTPHLGPTWARAYGSIIELADGQRQLVDEAYLTQSMMDPLAKMHRGFSPIMPSYQGLLTAGETGAIVEYIRALAHQPLPPEAPLAPAAAPREVSLPQSPEPEQPAAPAEDTEGNP